MRYRLIDVRLWGDKKFQALSPLPPCGQGLFLYLLTNPNTNAIPGLYRAGAAAMAEELGWELKAFHKALQEALDQGLIKVDLKARVIFIPNAIKYNKPQSPNVVKSWALCWDELPECELKTLAYQALKAFLEGLGEGFAKAFGEAINKPFGKTMPNQEQEPEQEPEQDLISSLREEVSGVAASPPPKCPHEEIIALYHGALPMCPPVKIWNEGRQGHLRQRWRQDTKHQSLEFWKSYFEHVKRSKFLTGQCPGRDGKPPFIASLEWLIKPNNFAKVVEGKYNGQ